MSNIRKFITLMHTSRRCYSAANVFDRKAKLLQKERAARNSDAKSYDYLKDEIGYRLSDRIFDIKREFQHVLDLGCGRGSLSKNFLPVNVKNLIMVDNCSTYLEHAEIPENINVKKIVSDEEAFTSYTDELDLVISCLNLHWVNDLHGCFEAIIKSLKKDGVFMAAIFGGDTLYELRSSLQLAELERKGGISPHVSPFIQIQDIGHLMNHAGFTMLTIDCDEVVVRYPSIFELMWDLKGMGENNAVTNRALHLRKSTMLAAAAIYEKLYGKIEDNKKYVPATFQIIYLLGWKPDASQSKPLKRGSGQISLKDIHKLNEIMKMSRNSKVNDGEDGKK